MILGTLVPAVLPQVLVVGKYRKCSHRVRWLFLCCLWSKPKWDQNHLPAQAGRDLEESSPLTFQEEKVCLGIDLSSASPSAPLRTRLFRQAQIMPVQCVSVVFCMEHSRQGCDPSSYEKTTLGSGGEGDKFNAFVIWECATHGDGPLVMELQTQMKGTCFSVLTTEGVCLHSKGQESWAQEGLRSKWNDKCAYLERKNSSFQIVLWNKTDTSLVKWVLFSVCAERNMKW